MASLATRKVLDACKLSPRNPAQNGSAEERRLRRINNRTVYGLRHEVYGLESQRVKEKPPFD
jgi:hypothetical protein